MQKFPVPDKAATINISLIGLAVCCFNEKYTDPKNSARKGRWEVAIPRNIKNHFLTIDLGLPGILHVSSNVKTIEIRDKHGVSVDNPKHEKDPFDRRHPETSDPLDYRWLADFNEISNTTPKDVTRVKSARVTMLYIYDATFYSQRDEQAGQIVVASQKDTGQVVKDQILSCPDYHSGPVLDTSLPIGFIGDKILADVHSPGKGKGVVEIIFDDKLERTYHQGSEPHKLIIQNMEPPSLYPDEEQKIPPGSINITVDFQYGRGDFFRYYEIFKVRENKKVHTWEKRDKIKREGSSGQGAEPAKTGDCNAVRIDSFQSLSKFFK
jgi:hypothetical protein